MTAADWRRVIDEAAALGVREVQFIGGEPTLHPALPELVRHALDRGLGVEIFSNLARPLSEEQWALFEAPGVRLATSYYSTIGATHEGITRGPAGSHRLTRSNIINALRRSIPIRVGIIDMRDGQDVEQARAELMALGVESIGVDRLRQVGRGLGDETQSVDQLCGKCADGVLAVSPTGEVWPCVFARWLRIGNVRQQSLKDIKQAAVPVCAGLRDSFSPQAGDDKDCNPCSPKSTPCWPDCTPHIQCNPCTPRPDKT
jgi:MoaA/NifB/PqqE/SkfB family radical SAM enzyme